MLTYCNHSVMMGCTARQPPTGLGALAGLAPDAGGEGTIFLLTGLDIADLIADYDQALPPGLAGGEVAFLDHYLAAGPPTDPSVTGAITIEIDDGSATANTHILA